MIYYTLTLTYIFKVKSSIFLLIFEHKYLANGLVRLNQILFVSCLGQRPYYKEKQLSYILKGSPQGQNLKNGGRDYLAIGKSICCEIWSGGSHKNGNEYLK